MAPPLAKLLHREHMFLRISPSVSALWVNPSAVLLVVSMWPQGFLTLLPLILLFGTGEP